MTKRIDQVDERAHKGQENLRDELTHVKSQARVDQAQLIRNTDQCLAESLAQANNESYEREARMTREIERLLNDHDSTYAHTMTSLEKRLDAKSDLMMRKLDAILNGSNWQERSNPRLQDCIRFFEGDKISSALPVPAECSVYTGRLTLVDV